MTFELSDKGTFISFEITSKYSERHELAKCIAEIPITFWEFSYQIGKHQNACSVNILKDPNTLCDLEKEISKLINKYSA